MKRPIVPVAGLIGEQALREAATTELHQVIELIRGAVRVAAAVREGEWVNIVAVYPDRAIVQREGRLYAYPWSLDDANNISLGQATEVVLDHKPVAMREGKPTAGARQAEPSGVETFVEALEGDASSPPRYLVRVIRAGTSLNGVNYPRAVLREAAPLFDGVRVFVKTDVEHIKGDANAKDFRRLVGKLTEPRFVEANGGEIQAVLDVLETAPVAATLREAVARGMTDLFGLSIDATGTAKKKGEFREATKLSAVTSVDLIIEPGAGGQVIRFVEARQEGNMKLREQMLKDIRARDAARANALADASDDEVLTAYREALASTQSESGGKAGGTPAEGLAGATAADIDARFRLIEARSDARVAIGAAALPQASKDRLLQRFAEAATIADGDVANAIKSEREYLMRVTEGARITGLGETMRVEAGQDRSEKVKAQLDEFFDPSKRARSFREAYIDITGDRGVTGLVNDCDMSRLREAVAGSRFAEAVSASTFADVLGDSITRAMIREYANLEAYNDWRWLCDVVPVQDFRTQERTRVGGYGNLPAVAENGNYAALTTPGDEKATYAATKRGGTETISLESIANDDVGLLRRIPLLLATAAGRTLYEFVYDFLATNAVIYDSVALFHATHANLGTAALDATSFAAARLAMKKQAELSSTKRLGITLRHLVIPSDLEEAAYNLFVRSSNQDETFVQSRKPTVHVVDYWTDANNWFASADNRAVPLIELGFYGGEDPAIFVQDNPTQGSLFSNDQIKYKIRHIYSGAVRDYRGFYGALVA